MWDSLQSEVPYAGATHILCAHLPCSATFRFSESPMESPHIYPESAPLSRGNACPANRTHTPLHPRRRHMDTDQTTQGALAHLPPLSLVHCTCAIPSQVALSVLQPLRHPHITAPACALCSTFQAGGLLHKPLCFVHTCAWTVHAPSALRFALHCGQYQSCSGMADKGGVMQKVWKPDRQSSHRSIRCSWSGRLQILHIRSGSIGASSACEDDTASASPDG